MTTESGNSSAIRVLRYILIVAFLYSLCVSIPYATEYRRVIPAIGLIFLSFSAIQSLVVLRIFRAIRKAFRPRHEYRIVLGNEEQLHEHANEGFRKVALGVLLVMADAGLAFVHALIFSLTIVEMLSNYSRWYRHTDILGTFASLSYLVAFFVHSALALIGVHKLSSELRISDLTRCPSCHASVFAAKSNAGQQGVATPPSRVQSEAGGPTAAGGPEMTGAYSDAQVADD